MYIIHSFICFVWISQKNHCLFVRRFPLLGAQDSGGLAPNIETAGPWQGLKGHKAQTFGFFAHDLSTGFAEKKSESLGFQFFGFQFSKLSQSPLSGESHLDISRLRFQSFGSELVDFLTFPAISYTNHTKSHSHSMFVYISYNS